MTGNASDYCQGSKRLLIGGRWQPAASYEELPSVNPATGATLARIAAGGPEDIDRAVVAARSAFEGEWSRWTPFDRQRLLSRINDLVSDNFEELAHIETMDMGVPISRVGAARNALSQTILFYASQTGGAETGTPRNSLPGQMETFTFKAPLGVIGGIIPWNAPLVSMWWIFGPTLATGCTCVIKPAEDASLTVLRMAELLQEAGVPDGVVNVVTGLGSTAGQALASHPDVDRVSFTGSTETGQKIIVAAAGNVKRVQLELGGKSPDLIFADANLDRAVPGAAMGVFGNSGQVCVAGTRLLVERSIQEEVVERLAEFSRTLRVGNGVDPDVQLGPLVSQKQLDRVTGYIEIGEREGARLVAGGTRLSGDLADGYFVEPTVFAGVNNDMRIAREEIFGPVISVIPFDDMEDALRLANDTPFGLGGGVWTQSLSTAIRMSKGIRSGTVWVNCYGAVDPAVGFGGYKMSGYGWKGSREHVESHLYRKAVYMNLE